MIMPVSIDLAVIIHAASSIQRGFFHWGSVAPEDQFHRKYQRYTGIDQWSWSQGKASLEEITMGA